MECQNGTVIPTNNTPLACDEYISTDCSIYADAIAYLGLPANSSVTAVIGAMLASLIDARNRILELETT